MENNGKKRPRIPKVIRDMARRIVEKFNPDKIILFGSHARGEAGPDSDVDLLVIMPVRGSKDRISIKIGVALGGMGVPNDVIVARPDELDRFQVLPGHVIRAAVREGIVLYERRAG